jgi:biotin carboxylase
MLEEKWAYVCLMKEWMSMQTIIFLGTRRHGTSREALRLAKEMGYYTVLFTDRRGIGKENEFPEVDEIIFMKDIFLKKELMNKIQKLQIEGKTICACMSFIDPFVSYAARISAELGRIHSSSDALHAVENKAKVREKLRGLESSPTFFVYENQVGIAEFAAAHKDFLPLILKPTESNGSKDIKLVKSEREMAEGLNYLLKKYPDFPILAEEYLEGPQYLIEVVVYRGEVRIIVVIEQECSSKSFLITGYKYPAKLSSEQETTLKRAIHDTIFHLGLSNGSCHLEMRIVNGKWKLVEVNPRMSGGVMNRLIEEGTGINLVKEILRMNVGEVPFLAPLYTQCAYAKYLTVDIFGRLLHASGQDRALLIEGVKYVYMKPEKGNILFPPRSMGDRYACIITCSETIEKAKSIARDAAKELKFYVEPL